MMSEEKTSTIMEGANAKIFDVQGTTTSISSEEKARTIMEAANAIILDVEGTTTSISYVKNVLFAYVERNLENYVNTHWEDEDMKDIVQTLINDQSNMEEDDFQYPPSIEDEKDSEDSEDSSDSDDDHLAKRKRVEREATVDDQYTYRKQKMDFRKRRSDHLPLMPSNYAEDLDFKNRVIAYLKWQQSKCLKTTGLKKLQGKILKEAYLSNEIKGHVYEDVPDFLKYWKNKGRKIVIFSHGSVEAQKLLFSNSTAGDLSEFLDGYFDTTIGTKQDIHSYWAIAEAIEEKPGDIVFVTDRPTEASTSKFASVRAIRMEREEFNQLLIEEKAFIGLEDAKVTSFKPLS